MSINSDGGAVFNEPGGDADFRVEGDSEPNLLVVDAGTDAVHVGDWDTNYTAFSKDGTQTMAGTARVKKALTVRAGGFRLGGAAPDQNTEGTFATLLFADNLTEVAYYNLIVEHDWAIGTDIEVTAFWAPTSAGAGTVAWEFDWEACSPNANQVLGAGSTHVDIHDDTQSLDNELLQTPYGTIAGASLNVLDTVGIMFYRDHDDASDNYVGDAALLHIEIEYVCDKLGEAIP
jgi:hypothetical protein